MFKYIIFVFLFLFNYSIALADESVDVVCVTEQDTVDLITLLDSSERDLELLDTCQKLVKDLYKEIDVRDIRIQKLTKDIITSKQDSLKYQASSKRWRNVALVTGTTSVVLLIIQVLPIL